ncbi:MAG: SUMF1/EgtB/PvdO family nonheme iron enzyme, partial [Planctomycetota bacterium]|nr:SUMF1/EgtB/PvdO family nonheme iron enzyme [Planctomycetota bacterium]
MRYRLAVIVWLAVVAMPILQADAAPAPSEAGITYESLRRAITDLVETYGPKYPKGKEYLARLAALEKASEAGGAATSKEKIEKGLAALAKDALLANPAIDFEQVLLVKRATRNLGLPQNWQGNSTIGPHGYNNEIAVLSMKNPQAPLKTFYRPQGEEFVGDMELHWNADRLIFSKPGTNGRFQVWEIKIDGTGLRQVTPGEHPDVDNYDACYLPDGRIIFCSTACYLGVPCVGGGDHVGALYLLGKDGKTIRQLTFDQDHSWCPTVLPSGRVLYTRWEYSDTPHYFTRILFEMNPDGTAQFEHYGSNSYWPNSIFYARPIPGSPTKIVAVISGHHGVPRMGELILFDPSEGRHETSGVVQRIPGYGKPVPARIEDALVDGSWPKFLHPWPLNEKYFLVAMQPGPNANWGVYLVDIFDNRVLLHEESGYAMFEPVPVRRMPMPPVIPDKVKLQEKTATVYLVDVYQGKGLEGVPRGTVKNLRVFTNHNGYRGMGGHSHIAIDGPWDARRILGTVPVYEDGSAMFKAPANVPLVVQPLDSEGRAVQVMRSWYTAMPGEVASCIGCHEPQSSGPPPARLTLATKAGPVPITPWRGPARPFGFKREVQPVLDKFCVSCHDGKPRPDGKAVPNFSRDQPARAREVAGDGNGFTGSYVSLHPFVRRPGPESDYHLPKPMEWHASTSELVQMLKKGHYGVQLDAEGWDRLYTWIDLNVPDHGTWSEYRQIAGKGHERRMQLAKQYAGLDLDPEAYPPMETRPVVPVKPQPVAAAPAPLTMPNWPLTLEQAQKLQADIVRPAATTAPNKPEQKIDLGGSVMLEMVLVPAGEFIMGAADGALDERPQTRIRVDKPFWMGRFEITNGQFQRFDPAHDSGLERLGFLHYSIERRGAPMNGPLQPAVRVSWQQAVEFCRWLSQKTGRHFTLPTEAQWEYACRAGAAGPFACELPKPRVYTPQDQHTWAKPPTWTWYSHDIGPGPANAWGLHDMHVNVAEWTLSTYRPYPYRDDDGRNTTTPEG